MPSPFADRIHLRRFLKSGIFVALLFSGIRAAEPYAQKPEWWDSAVRAVPLQMSDSLQETYTKTRDPALERFRIPHTPWWIVGPFAAPEQLDTQHPPLPPTSPHLPPSPWSRSTGATTPRRIS